MALAFISLLTSDAKRVFLCLSEPFVFIEEMFLKFFAHFFSLSDLEVGLFTFLLNFKSS